ncbi:rhodanese-like domain-containing protein [uncultured Gemella sp.]|uniref:rhodanese-like domain-containing protein n=1 Tax=uncultured Gemella sp. TaxID=254352 RepID=UPI002600D607|nr:rhodanese-like domain-containing protein [uncultured Gemella sp.]
MKNNISMKDFYEKYTNSSEKLTILDVREIHEYAAGHIPSAENFPLSTLGSDFSKLDKNQKYYVICQAGGRSAKAYDFLVAEGFDVINVEGGMNNWPGETK